MMGSQSYVTAMGTVMALSALMAVSPTSAQMSLPDLAFMSGCWEGNFGSGDRRGVIEERYTSPSANIMLGTTRYLSGGRAVQFELTVLNETGGSVTLTPYPGGTRSEDDFTLTELDSRRAVFESPEHDFPKRIIYDGSTAGQITATIDGGATSTKRQTWQMHRVACEDPK